MQQTCTDCNGLRQIVENLCQAVMFCLILCQHPRLRLINIFVTAAEQCNYLGNGIGYTKLLHLLTNLCLGSCHHSLQIIIHILGDTGGFYNTSKIFIAHGNGTVHQISKDICQVGIIALNYKIPGDHTIVLIRHLMQHKITCGIHTEQIHHIIRVDHISLGLTHLIPAL